MQMKLLSISFVIVTLPFCIEEDDMQAKPHITAHHCPLLHTVQLVAAFCMDGSGVIVYVQ